MNSSAVVEWEWVHIRKRKNQKIYAPDSTPVLPRARFQAENESEIAPKCDRKPAPNVIETGLCKQTHGRRHERRSYSFNVLWLVRRPRVFHHDHERPRRQWDLLL